MAVKVFVSSTYVDLQAHRQRVIAQLRRAGYHVDPDGGLDLGRGRADAVLPGPARRLPGLCAPGRVPPGVRPRRAGAQHHPDGVRSRP